MKKFNKDLSHNNGLIKKCFVAFLCVSLSASILACFWFLSQLGPKKVDYSNIKYNAEIPEAVKDIQKESLKLEAQFNEIASIREITAEDVAILKQSLDKQKKYLEEITGVDSEAYKRQLRLEDSYQDLAARALKKESIELEQQAEAFSIKKDYESARKAYRKSFEKQQQINENFPRSSSYSISRATLLSRQAVNLTAEPLFQRSITYEKEAELLLEAKEWVQAEERLLQAINLQDRLNREYRGITQADVSRLKQLRVKLISIRSAESNSEIERIVKLAEKSLAANENFEAAALYEEAARLQNALNETYRESLYNSSQRVSEFTRLAQTCKSLEIGLEIERKHDQMKFLLAERRSYEAGNLIIALRRNIRQMRTSFPRSSLNNEDLELKIRYLSLIQNDIEFIQGRIYKNLLPIPGIRDYQMLNSEVSQALYSTIMGTNPSRNLGDFLPVDSVNWIDAKNFCERLCWILGKSVRLPTENEFRQGLGKLKYVVLEDHTWNASNANGITQNIKMKEPFASGYYDLLGNVSEWLESVDQYSTEDALNIGGHAQDRLESIFTVPIREASRSERSRLIGFRIVVKKDH